MTTPEPTIRVRHKVFAYVTHGDRLLVFSHPDFPEAGIQVVAGTVEEGEPPEEAVQREAFEETGLEGLRLSAFLGEREFTVPGWEEVHRRRFYHLTYEGEPPARWFHLETDPSDGSPAPITFEFFWAELPDGVPELMEGRLLEVLGIGG